MLTNSLMSLFFIVYK